MNILIAKSEQAFLNVVFTNLPCTPLPIWCPEELCLLGVKNAFIMVVMSDFGLICGAVLVFLDFGNTSIFLYAGGT